MAVKRGDRTYRVSQIPSTWDRYQLVRFLVDFHSSIGTFDNVQVFSFAQSANIWEKPRSRVATVAFHTLPACFDNEAEQWQLPIPHTVPPWNVVVDLHFRDFTPFNDPEDDNHVSDCIAISGLASHPFGSWKEKGKSTYMWLRDGLSFDVTSTKVMIFGYDTQIIESQSFQSIQDIANTFAVKLRTIGRSSPSAKPLILIGHSQGGIVLKQAILMLANRTQEDQSILSSVKGVFLFGVPHKGMKISHLLAMSHQYPNERLVRSLSEDSDYLLELAKRFKHHSALRSIRLVSAYETRKSPTSQRDDTGLWTRSGPLQILVEPASAVVGYEKETTFNIDADHSALVKFPSNDGNYRLIVNCLHEVNQQSSNQPPGLQPSCDLRTVDEDRKNDRYRRVFESLSHPKLGDRFDQVSDPTETTFSWIFDSKHQLQAWLMEEGGLFWIQGKPGSGKSTLMKYICQDNRVQETLEARRDFSSLVVAKYFFHDRGTILQKSMEGLLRAVLYEVMERFPELGQHVISGSGMSDEMKPEWSLDRLSHVFNLILGQTTVDISLVLFIDAIDEHNGSADIISHFIKDSVDLDSQNSKTKVKICFSGRPWNVFMDAFDGQRGVRMEDQNEKDISEFFNKNLKGKPSFDQLCLIGQTSPSNGEDDLLKTDPIQVLVQKSEGVFLWAKVVADELQMACTDGVTCEELARIIDGLPTELRSLYERAIAKIPPKFHDECYIMMEVLARSGSLPLDRFLEITECAKLNSVKECQERLQSMRMSQFSGAELSSGRRRIRRSCGNLVDVRNIDADDGSLPNESTIYLIHQTAKEFILSYGFQSMLQISENLSSQNGYTFLSKDSLGRLAWCAARANQGLEIDYGHDHNNPLALRHLSLAEKTTGRSQKHFIDTASDELFQVHLDFQGLISYLLDSSYARFPDSNQAYIELFKLSLSKMSLAVALGLQIYVKETLQAGHPIDNASGLSFLHVAFLADFFFDVDKTSKHDMIELLVNRGADVNCRYENLTPLELGVCYYMAWHKTAPSFEEYWVVLHMEVLDLVFKKGQDPNAQVSADHWKRLCQDQRLSKGSSHDTFRLVHWFSWDPAAFHILVSNGADPNALDSKGRTPLDKCIESLADRNSRLHHDYYAFASHCYPHFPMSYLLKDGAKISSFGKSFLPQILKDGAPHPDVLKNLPVLEKSERRLHQRLGDRFKKRSHRF